MNQRRVFAIADPHLSFASPKPMDVFGPHWRDHASRLADNWRETVDEDDIVLLSGDISWAMRLDEALPDLRFLSALPGEKILIRGNHDYWWSSLGKLNALGLPGMYFVQNNCVVMDGLAAGGSRLWDFPGVYWPFAGRLDDAPAPAAETGKAAPREGDPEKIRARELERLSASLSKLPSEAKIRVAMTHFPPIGADGAPTALSDLIGRFAIDLCVFGHVHGPRPDQPRPGEDIVIGKTRYLLTASDFLGHRPKLVAEL